MHFLPVYMASAHLWLLFSLYPFIARQCLLPTVKTGKSEHTDLTQNNILPSPESFVHLKGAQKVEIHLYIEILMSASFRLWGLSVLNQASCASGLLVPLAALWVLWQKQRRRRKRRMKKKRTNSSVSPHPCSSSSAFVFLPRERCRRSLERSLLSFHG